MTGQQTYNLEWAFFGFKGCKKLEAAGLVVGQKVSEKNRGKLLVPGDAFFKSSSGIQKLAYNSIFETIFPDLQGEQLIEKCSSRCASLFLPYDIFENDGPDFADAFELLRGSSGPIVVKTVKTWLNGWATSHRMHEDVVHDCLFGCSGALDSLNHYVMCPHLFALQRFHFENISECPLVRFGIKSPEQSSLKVISCTFSAYHALKGKVRAGRINLHTLEWRRTSWCVFAEALRAEAGELRLQCRAFSVPHFLNFLVTGRTQAPPANSTAIQDSH